MTTVVIFGGAGFIGSTLSNFLSSQEYFSRIIAIGRSPYPKLPLHSKVEYIQGNAADAQFVAGTVARADAVIDLTYSTVPQTSYDNPLLEVTLNLPACINIMQQCMNHGVKRYLLVSSGGTVYGNTEEPIITESHPTNPISPYGIAKLTMEKYAFFFHQNFGLQVVVARPSNPFGLHQIGNKPQGFIGNAISCLRNRRPVTVYGQQGTIRDYIYIDDLVRGLVDCFIYGTSGTSYNISTGFGMNNIQALTLIENIFSEPFVKIQKQSARPFDVNTNVLDSTKLHQLNGWQPTMSVASGLARIKGYLQ